MPARPERRRRQRAELASPSGGGASLIRTRELAVASFIAGGLLAGLIVYLLLSGGDDQQSSGPMRFSPSTPDEIAIEALARQSIEVLPRGEWPSLYESFTPEYQQRCPRDEFVAAGEVGAQEQGENLPLLRFVGLEDVAIAGETATATIVGEVTGSGEYRVRGAFEKVDATWKLAPASGTEGCSAFDRVVPT